MFLYQLVILIFTFSFSQNNVGSFDSFSIIPFPQEISIGSGRTVFKSVSLNNSGFLNPETADLSEYFSRKKIPVTKNGQLQIIIKIEKVKNPWKIEGAYKLSISDKIVISAESDVGIFYGIQTLKQIIEKDNNKFFVSHCEINDWPAFKIRGFMHDVGRNYQTPDLLKEQIDRMAAYKYNVFHIHLTDNPGWRLESKIYPQLQSEEATTRKPGKFYTQEEFKDILDFCEQRHISVIPEIDIPGHTLAFRKALGIQSMNSPRVQKIIMELIDELCALAPAEKMPYIHLGTDEVRETSEKVDEDFLVPIIRKVEENNRKYISWWHGIQTHGDSNSIKQLWAQSEALAGYPFIDSRSNYINHLDPLAGIGRLFFQQPCRTEHGDSLRLGGILCCWPDNKVDEERNLLLQNSVYPFMVTYSESIWRGVKSTGNKYWAQLPPVHSKEYEYFTDFENRLAVHRDKYFQGKEFPFIKNAQVPWKIIGPFEHNDDFPKSFEVEKKIQNSYEINGTDYHWRDTDLYGGTVHLKHFFGFPSPIEENKGTVYALNYVYSEKEQEVDFWIGFQNWSRSGRRGGPTPQPGQWHFTNPKIWVNDKEILPPNLNQPGLGINTPEIPFVDEDYYYRNPHKIKLQKGWNKFLLKVPFGENAWKWMFTCVPLQKKGEDVREVQNLKYSTKILN